MYYTKPKIYNLALSTLLLVKEVVDPDSDPSNEVRVLNMHWDIALESTLKDLDLTSLSTTIILELIEELDSGPWNNVYKYPNTCALLRRVVSGSVVDNSRTHIPKIVAIHNGQKAIFTDEYEAIAEIIPNTVPLNALNANAGLALAYKLAYLSAPLITGKGAQKLRDSIMQAYIIAKTEAQEDDARESFFYETDDTRSEFIAARIE